MSKFTLKRIELVKGKIGIYKLLVDGNCEFDAFCSSLHEKERIKVEATIHATLEAFSNQTLMRGNRFKELKRPKSDDIKDYEVKVNKYRIYLFKDTKGSIVVFGGFKKNQDKDIKRLRQLKQEYNKSARK